MFRNRPVSHIGYSVTDLEESVTQWARTLGAGPFFYIENIPFDIVTSEGNPADSAHSSAFVSTTLEFEADALAENGATGCGL